MQKRAIVAALAVVALIMAGTFALVLMANPVSAHVDRNNWQSKDEHGYRNYARVRVIHASPDAPAVDVWVNGAPAFTNLSFKGITSYARLRAGTYHIQVVPHGVTSPVVIDATLTLGKRTDYTIMAIGVLAHIHPLVLVDSNRPVRDDMVRVRFVHASPDAPAVDIAVHDGPVLFSNVSFGQSGGYITVPAGTYPLEVRLAGTQTVVLSLGNVTLKEEQVYSAFAVGLVGDGSLTALLSHDSSHHMEEHED